MNGSKGVLGGWGGGGGREAEIRVKGSKRGGGGGVEKGR